MASKQTPKNGRQSPVKQRTQGNASASQS